MGLGIALAIVLVMVIGGVVFFVILPNTVEFKPDLGTVEVETKNPLLDQWAESIEEKKKKNEERFHRFEGYNLWGFTKEHKKNTRGWGGDSKFVHARGDCPVYEKADQIYVREIITVDKGRFRNTNGFWLDEYEFCARCVE